MTVDGRQVGNGDRTGAVDIGRYVEIYGDITSPPGCRQVRAMCSLHSRTYPHRYPYPYPYPYPYSYSYPYPVPLPLTLTLNREILWEQEKIEEAAEGLTAQLSLQAQLTLALTLTLTLTLNPNPNPQPYPYPYPYP